MMVVPAPPRPLHSLGAFVDARWRLDVARASHPVHLPAYGDRIPDVLQGVAADDKVEGLVGEGERPGTDVHLMIRLGSDAELAFAVTARALQRCKRHDVDDMRGG